MEPAVTFLGFFVSKDGMRQAESSNKVILEAHEQKVLKQLKSFLGMLSNHRNYLLKISDILETMNNLLTK